MEVTVCYTVPADPLDEFKKWLRKELANATAAKHVRWPGADDWFEEELEFDPEAAAWLESRIEALEEVKARLSFLLSHVNESQD